jgi:hypothetical protein
MRDPWPFRHSGERQMKAGEQNGNHVDACTTWFVKQAHRQERHQPAHGEHMAGGGQSGLHVLAAERLLVFANNSKTLGGSSSSTVLGGTGDGSLAIELALDLPGKQASQVWSYKAVPGIQNDVMGDVQRLPNGNTIIGYSTKGVLREVDAGGTLLQEWTWGLGVDFGYVEKRASLYGQPLR